MAAELLDRLGGSWIRRFGDVLGPTASLVGTTVITSALGFAYWWAAARLAPIHQVGAATAVISTMILLGSIGMFGFGTMLIAEAGRCRGAVGSLVATSMLVVLVLATGLAAASWAVLQFAHGAVGEAMASPGVAAGFIIGVGLTAVGLVLDQALVGIRASSVQLYRNSYFSLVKLALLVLLALAVGRSEVTMVWAWVVGTAVSMVATTGHLAARGYRLGQPIRLSELRSRATTTFRHNTLNISVTLPRMALPLLVATLLGTHANAGFYAAWMITTFLYVLPMQMSTVLFAVAVGDTRGLAPRLQAALKVSLLLGGSVAVAVAALAGVAMRSFGPGYGIAAPALAVMAFAYFPNMFKQFYVAVARVDNKLRKAGAVCGAGGALELGLAGTAGYFGGLTGCALGFFAAVAMEAVYYLPRVLRAVRLGEHDESAAPSARRSAERP